jgi:hypothetical protein
MFLSLVPDVFAPLHVGGAVPRTEHLAPVISPMERTPLPTTGSRRAAPKATLLGIRSGRLSARAHVDTHIPTAGDGRTSSGLRQRRRSGIGQRHTAPGEEAEERNGCVSHRHILSPDVPARLPPPGRKEDRRPGALRPYSTGAERRPVALRPILSSGLPFSGV